MVQKGIWIVPTTKDVRKWYEIVNGENYEIDLKKEEDSLILKYKSLDDEGFDYFPFLIKGITDSSCPYLETLKSLTYGRNIVSLNNGQQVLTLPIKPEWQTLILKCSQNQNHPIATTLFVDEEDEPVKLNNSALIFAKYATYGGIAINNAHAQIIVNDHVYQMQNIHNRYEFSLRAFQSGYIPYTIKISKNRYESQHQDMSLLVH